MVTEFPTEKPLLSEEAPDSWRTPKDPTEEDLIGEAVFFVTQVGAWPAVVVAYDTTTRRARLQVFNKKIDGCTLSAPIRHISTEDTPCWAWKHETPFQGLQSLNRGPEPRKRAHTRKSVGGITV